MRASKEAKFRKRHFLLMTCGTRLYTEEPVLFSLMFYHDRAHTPLLYLF